MSSSLVTMAIYVTLGAGPFGFGGSGCSTCAPIGCATGPPYGGFYAGGFVGNGSVVGGVMGDGAGMVSGGCGSGDPLFWYNDPQPWMHGYFQHMPAYDGHQFFRPYNYKHVYSQSVAAASWAGERYSMPYSHAFWHRYREVATMKKLFDDRPYRR